MLLKEHRVLRLPISQRTKKLSPKRKKNTSLTLYYPFPQPRVPSGFSIFLKSDSGSGGRFHSMAGVCCVSCKSEKKGVEHAGANGRKKRIKGTVKLMKKNVLDLNDMKASIFDRINELLGKGVTLQLISSDRADPGQSFCATQLIL